MFISITVYIRFSEVNESCLAADHSALQLLTVISSLKLLFTVPSKERKIHAKKETMQQNKNEHLRKKTLLEKGVGRVGFLKISMLFSEHTGDGFLHSDGPC